MMNQSKNLIKILNYSIRSYSTSTRVVKFTEFGKANQVLKVVDETISDSNLQGSEILVEMIHAPINPVDFNLVNNTYGFSASLPSIAGSEGVGIVKKVGAKVTGLKANDYVVPVIGGKQLIGTWRQKGIFNEKQFHKVPNDIPTEYLASISINPSTAYRLLEDFVKLSEGDVIIQNASSGMVGLSVVQMAKARGIKTISVIRNGPDYDEQVQLIKGLGGDIVVPEDYIRTQAFQKLISDIPKPKLALNAVGGASATELVRTLADNGTIVTYGGMSREPVIIPTSHLIFRNITSKGFWLNNWMDTNSNEATQEMFDKIFNLIRKKQLKLFIEKYKFSDFENALIRSQESGKGRKILLDLQL